MQALQAFPLRQGAEISGEGSARRGAGCTVETGAGENECKPCRLFPCDRELKSPGGECPPGGGAAKSRQGGRGE